MKHIETVLYQDKNNMDHYFIIDFMHQILTEDEKNNGFMLQNTLLKYIPNYIFNPNSIIIEYHIYSYSNFITTKNITAIIKII